MRPKTYDNDFSGKKDLNESCLLHNYKIVDGIFKGSDVKPDKCWT